MGQTARSGRCLISDVRDFLDFLDKHVGVVVSVEIGMRADDLPHTSRPTAMFHGPVGPMQMEDDEDRAERGVAFVPIGPQGEQRVGFHVEADRVTEVVVNHIGGKVWFVDDHYIAVVP
jgi:hypothetical protein